MGNSEIKNIIILMAMQKEADPLINSLNLAENSTLLSPQLPFRCFQKKFEKSNLSLLTSGTDHRNLVDNIGCEAATLMAYESIRILQPDVIISAGTPQVDFQKKGQSLAASTLAIAISFFMIVSCHCRDLVSLLLDVFLPQIFP